MQRSEQPPFVGHPVEYLALGLFGMGTKLNRLGTSSSSGGVDDKSRGTEGMLAIHAAQIHQNYPRRQTRLLSV